MAEGAALIIEETPNSCTKTNPKSYAALPNTPRTPLPCAIHMTLRVICHENDPPDKLENCKHLDHGASLLIPTAVPTE